MKTSSLLRTCCRRRMLTIAASLALLFFTRFPAALAADTHDHSFLTSYEGSKTCRTCHEAAVDDLTHAVHYRLLGNVQGVYDMFTNKPVTGEKGKGNRY
jgi:hypothetical protein